MKKFCLERNVYACNVARISKGVSEFRWMIIPCCVLCHAQVMSKARNTTLCASHLFFLQRAFSWEAHHKHERKKMNYVKKTQRLAAQNNVHHRRHQDVTWGYFVHTYGNPSISGPGLTPEKVSWREDVAINRSCTLRLRVKTDDALPLKIMKRS